MKIIQEALQRGATTLSENESKQLLAGYGIPVTKEKVVGTQADAVAAADAIGYPVVLKGSGDTLSHKSELNLIVLDLRTQAEVRDAFEKLTTHPKAPVKEVLVQQMVKGDRELVVGMTRDAQFGPCVMFGIGGIFTEIFKDTAFRSAPLSRLDALDMMAEIRGAGILEAIRGKAAIDRQILADILVAVGKIALDHPNVKEIDINPLKFVNGRPVAVDALAVLG